METKSEKFEFEFHIDSEGFLVDKNEHMVTTKNGIRWDYRCSACQIAFEKFDLMFGYWARSALAGSLVKCIPPTITSHNYINPENLKGTTNIGKF
jgi:hypothetical protein